VHSSEASRSPSAAPAAAVGSRPRAWTAAHRPAASGTPATDARGSPGRRPGDRAAPAGDRMDPWDLRARAHVPGVALLPGGHGAVRTGDRLRWHAVAARRGPCDDDGGRRRPPAAGTRDAVAA